MVWSLLLNQDLWKNIFTYLTYLDPCPEDSEGEESEIGTFFYVGSKI